MKIGKRPLVDQKSFRINPSKFFSLLVSAVIGYAFAILTIKVDHCTVLGRVYSKARVLFRGISRHNGHVNRPK